MSSLEDVKKKYDEIPIPGELSGRIRQAVDYSEKGVGNRTRHLQEDGEDS